MRNCKWFLVFDSNQVPAFTLTDAVEGSVAIQYNNGNFNGLFYLADFGYQGNNYRFDDEGGTVTIFLLDSLGEETGSGVASGYLNFSLTNVTPFADASSACCYSGAFYLCFVGLWFAGGSGGGLAQGFIGVMRWLLRGLLCTLLVCLEGF
jgi:hypothetical protein